MVHKRKISKDILQNVREIAQPNQTKPSNPPYLSHMNLDQRIVCCIETVLPSWVVFWPTQASKFFGGFERD